MSLAGFDTLRANQIDRAAAIDRLEGVMTSLLQRHRDSVIDDQIVAQITRIQPRTVLDDLLAALVKADALAEKWFWNCPNGRGTIMERDRYSDFPEDIECERCGGRHAFDVQDVEVFFVPTNRLLQSVTAHAGTTTARVTDATDASGELHRCGTTRGQPAVPEGSHHGARPEDHRRVAESRERTALRRRHPSHSRRLWLPLAAWIDSPRPPQDHARVRRPPSAR